MSKIRALSAFFAAAIASLIAIREVGAIAIVDLPGVASITVWEDTRFVLTDPLNEVTLAVTDSRLSTRLTTLDASNNDFTSVVGEFYDFFFSNADGTANSAGAFLTIEARFNPPMPSNGGNISRVDLRFLDSHTEFANLVSSFVLFSPGDAHTVVNAVDGDLNTTTLLGNTNNTVDRLRLTVGFASTGTPGDYNINGAVDAPDFVVW